MYMSARLIIFDCIFTQIPDHLIQNPVNSFIFHFLPAQFHRNMVTFGHIFQTDQNVLADTVEIDFFFFQSHTAFIQFGKLDDILHKHNQTACLFINAFGKSRHILLLYKPAFHNLRIT